MCGQEQWRDVVGYVGLYRCSDLGRVMSVDRVVPNGRGGTVRRKGRILRPILTNRKRYFGVKMCNERGRRLVPIHRIVAVAFVGPRPDGYDVHHTNGDPFDNRACNLCYLSHGDHSRIEHTICVVRSDGAVFDSIMQAAEESGCQATHICACCKGKRNRAGGFGWRYSDGARAGGPGSESGPTAGDGATGGPGSGDGARAPGGPGSESGPVDLDRATGPTAGDGARQ
jgi:hypothetical protein